MMFGRGFYGRGNIMNSGNIDSNSCFGNGGYAFMHNGWSMLIVIGVLLIITILIYLLARKNKKKMMNYPVVETLKMKYVQGEITEEEYIKRKAVIDK